jgi:putative PIN family toxin of toxin-antitoxin system
VIRAVLDANVVLSAMLNPAGRPAEVVGKVRVAFDLVWSPAIVAECHRAADYRKLRTRFRVPDPHRFIDDLADAAILIDADLPKLGILAADPPDEIYLSTALAGAAGWVVTGDRRHLLPVREFAGVRIVAPTAFLSEL